MQNFPTAPELNVSSWLNTDKPVTLESLRGKVVFIECFQMLCPGCVSHGLPQAQKLYQIFNRDQVEVLGLHTVFEHHEAQGTEAALKAFLHEYRIPFPVGIDTPGVPGPTPQTMSTYRLRGTPSILLIDRQGRLRKNHFGQVDDMVLGAEVMALVGESAVMPEVEDKATGVCPAP